MTLFPPRERRSAGAAPPGGQVERTVKRPRQPRFSAEVHLMSRVLPAPTVISRAFVRSPGEVGTTIELPPLVVNVTSQPPVLRNGTMMGRSPSVLLASMTGRPSHAPL